MSNATDIVDADAATIAAVLTEIAELTAPTCGNSPECELQGHGGRPYRCCSRLYCEAVRQYCRSKGITLTDTGHSDLPFMGPDGCTLSPEHRPICVIHTCQWSGSARPHCGDAAITARYAELYNLANAIDDGWWKAFESVRDIAGDQS